MYMKISGLELSFWKWTTMATPYFLTRMRASFAVFQEQSSQNKVLGQTDVHSHEEEGERPFFL